MTRAGAWLQSLWPFGGCTAAPVATTSTEIVDMAEENERLKAALALSESCRANLQKEVDQLKAKLRSRASKKGWDTRRKKPLSS